MFFISLLQTGKYLIQSIERIRNITQRKIKRWDVGNRIVTEAAIDRTSDVNHHSHYLGSTTGSQFQYSLFLNSNANSWMLEVRRYRWIYRDEMVLMAEESHAKSLSVRTFCLLHLQPFSPYSHHRYLIDDSFLPFSLSQKYSGLI